MNRYIKILKSFLAEKTPYFGCDDANSILEMLYYFYIEENPIDSAVIRCQFKKLDDVLSKLSLVDNDRVFSLAVDLCDSHTKKAFLEGVHIGMRLFTELQNESYYENYSNEKQ